MILGYSRLIREVVREGMLTPTHADYVQPCSIDVHLAEELVIVSNGIRIVSPGGRYVLDPGEFVLASTHERIALPVYLRARVEGVSTIGRSGLFIHNAGFIDPGFHGNITLELFNASSREIVLVSGQRIAQIEFAEVDGAIMYKGRYQDAVGVEKAKDG